jgi:ArsR family transcriptional regulator
LTIINVFDIIRGMKISLRQIPIINQSKCDCGVTVTPMAPERAAQLAEQLRALADATRLRMLDLLVRQEIPVCVCDITAQFAQQQPTISHHLRLLREAGLVDCEKRGIWAYYWATEAGKTRLAAVQELV